MCKSNYILRLVFISILTIGNQLAIAFASDRDVWIPINEVLQTAFVRHPHGYWLEMSMAGHEFRFEEESRDDTFIELHDPARQIRIRLFGDYAELRSGENPYSRWKVGGWGDRSHLPSEFEIKLPDYKLRLIYFIANDREPTDNYKQKITTLMGFTKGLYAYELQRRGIKDGGLKFETEDDGSLKIHLVRASRPASRYSQAPAYDAHKQWSAILEDIPEQIASPWKNLMIVFAETYDEGPAKWEWPGGIALGAKFGADGGCGIFSAWILRDEFCAPTMAQQVALLNNNMPIPGRIALGHGQMNSPRYEFIEDGFGAVAHELGHAIGLPHDSRIDNRYIMGNGFRELRINLDRRLTPNQRVRFSDDNAWLLAGSRFLNPDVDRTDNQSPTGNLTLRRLAEESFAIRLAANDDQALFAAVFFDGVRGSVVGSRELTGQSQEVELVLPLKPDNATGMPKLSVRIIDRGGNSQSVESK